MKTETQMHVTGTIAGRGIDRMVAGLAATLKESAASGRGDVIFVDGRALDVGALPVAVAVGDREPTREELAAALV